MHAYDDLEESMGLILRGKERVENKSLGGRADVYTQDPEALLHACQTRGSDCRRVPFDELTKPWNQRRKPGFRRLTGLGRSEATSSRRRLCPCGVLGHKRFWKSSRPLLQHRTALPPACSPYIGT